LVIGAIGVFIFFKLKDEDNFNDQLFASIKEAFSGYGLYAVMVVFIMMPINWLLESKKWQLLAKPVAKLSLLEALKGVLSGLSIGFITPHGIGAYVGRVLMLDTQERGKLLGALLLSRLLQLLATLIFGTLGVWYLVGTSIVLVYIIIICCLIISGVLLLNLDFKFHAKFIRRIAYYLDIVRIYKTSALIRVFLLACLRYLVFASQFVIVLSLFIKEDFILKTSGITWIFLAKSILPTFNFLSDLGVREFSAIYFFDQYHVPVIPVLAASLLVWAINILAPTIIGAPLIMRLKLKV